MCVADAAACLLILPGLKPACFAVVAYPYYRAISCVWLCPVTCCTNMLQRSGSSNYQGDIFEGDTTCNKSPEEEAHRYERVDRKRNSEDGTRLFYERVDQAVSMFGAHLQDAHKTWVLVFVKAGMQVAIEHIVSYYGNMAVVAALLCGFSLSQLVSPPTDYKMMTSKHTITADSEWAMSILGYSGSVSFVFYIASVLDCVMLSNSVRQLASGRHLLDFIQSQGSWFETPVRIFILATILLSVQLCMYVYILFGTNVVIITSFAVAFAFWLVFRRFLSSTEYLAKCADDEFAQVQSNSVASVHGAHEQDTEGVAAFFLRRAAGHSFTSFKRERLNPPWLPGPGEGSNLYPASAV